MCVCTMKVDKGYGKEVRWGSEVMCVFKSHSSHSNKEENMCAVS